MNDAQTLNMLLNGGRKRERKARKPLPKFTIGMAVTYCGKPAKIVGKEGRTWQVECEGQVWPSTGRDMKPAGEDV